MGARMCRQARYVWGNQGKTRGQRGTGAHRTIECGHEVVEMIYAKRGNHEGRADHGTVLRDRSVGIRIFSILDALHGVVREWFVEAGFYWRHPLPKEVKREMYGGWRDKGGGRTEAAP